MAVPGHGARRSSRSAPGSQGSPGRCERGGFGGPVEAPYVPGARACGIGDTRPSSRWPPEGSARTIGPVNVTTALDAIWSGHRRGQHHPPEWQGRLTMVEAYHVQLGLLDRYVGAGDHHAGWKVGLTAKAMQEQQRVHEPVFGFLLESGHRDHRRRVRLQRVDPARLRE